MAILGYDVRILTYQTLPTSSLFYLSPLHPITFFPSALPFFDEAIVLSGRPGSIIAPMRLDCMTAADDTGHQKFRQSIKQTVA